MLSLTELAWQASKMYSLKRRTGVEYSRFLQSKGFLPEEEKAILEIAEGIARGMLIPYDRISIEAALCDIVRMEKLMPLRESEPCATKA